MIYLSLKRKLAAKVGQLTAISECDLVAVAPKAFGEIVALIRCGHGGDGASLFVHGDQWGWSSGRMN